MNIKFKVDSMFYITPLFICFILQKISFQIRNKSSHKNIQHSKFIPRHYFTQSVGKIFFCSPLPLFGLFSKGFRAPPSPLPAHTEQKVNWKTRALVLIHTFFGLLPLPHSRNRGARQHCSRDFEGEILRAFFFVKLGLFLYYGC